MDRVVDDCGAILLCYCGSREVCESIGLNGLRVRPGRPEAAFDNLHPELVAESITTLIAEWRAADQAVAHLPLEYPFVSDR